MVAQVFAGLFTEGGTDIRFLLPIVQRTFEAIAFDCSGQIDVEVQPIHLDKTGLGFVGQVLQASKKGAEELSIQIICVHADADYSTSENTYQSKINPAKAKLEQQNENEYCKLLVAIIPIQETESWMLADKELLKQEIGTTLTNQKLDISKEPEIVANPKEAIENAIRIARAGLTQKRRKELKVADLYLPIGQSINLEKLETLSSYQDFKNNVRTAFKNLNLLHK